jgi:hypothetical protein
MDGNLTLVLLISTSESHLLAWAMIQEYTNL